MTDQDVAIDFRRRVASGKVRKAFDRHVATGFRHHHPDIAGDGVALVAAMADNAAVSAQKSLPVPFALQDGDRVAVFSRIRQRPDDHGAAVVHLFRCKDGKIIELWDVSQDVPVDSPNENGMF